MLDTRCFSTEGIEYPIYAPRAAGWRGHFGRLLGPVLLLLIFFAPIVPIFDFTEVFGSGTSYGRGNMALVLTYAIAVMGLNLLVGWCGQIGLAQAGLFGFGAYFATELCAKGVPFVIALVVLAVIAAAVGIAVGFPAARLKGFYLAIATLAFGELVVKLLELDQVGGKWLDTGGGAGRNVSPQLLMGMSPSLSAYYWTFAVFLLVVVSMAILARGRLGRTLKAVKHIEIATGPIGISATKYKLVAFGYASAVGALAGALYAQNVTFLNPGAFRSSLLFYFLIVLIVGGTGRLWGPLVGSVFFVALREQLQDALDISLLVFGGALMLSVLVLPGGLTSLPERVLRSRLLSDLASKFSRMVK
jgi:branched-chain amino acid transport system permease protein